MLRIVIAFSLTAALAAAALAQDSFIPGNESTLKWVDTEKGFKQMLETARPGFLYIYSTHKAGFCKTVEKEIIPQRSLRSKFKKFVCLKLSSDAESEILRNCKVASGKAAVLFLDCQGEAVQTINESPDLAAFKAAFKKTEKANRPMQKFLKNIEKLYKTGEKHLKREAYHKATQYFQAIIKKRDLYEEKKNRVVNSPYFKKAEKKLKEIEEEGTKLLIKARAAIGKADFGSASTYLGKLRAQFALFPDIMKKVEQAELELQQQMQRASQQGQGK